MIVYTQHGYLIDGGRPSEIRPVPDRLRKMLHLPAAEEEDIVMVGAHILRLVDPLPDFLEHAACGGNAVFLKITLNR